MDEDDRELIHRLTVRALIRRKNPARKSVQEGKPDRLADLLEQAAARLQQLTEKKD